MSKRSTKHLYPGFNHEEISLIEAALMLDHDANRDRQNKQIMKQALADVVRESKKPSHVANFKSGDIMTIFAALTDCEDAVMDSAKQHPAEGGKWVRKIYPKLVERLRHNLLNGVIVPSRGRLPKVVRRLKRIAKRNPRQALDLATRHIEFNVRTNCVAATESLNACLLDGLQRTADHRFIDPIKLALHDPSLKQNRKLYRALKRQQAKGRKYVIIKVHGKSVYAGPVTSKRACAGLDRSLDVEKDQRKVIENA